MGRALIWVFTFFNYYPDLKFYRQNKKIWCILPQFTLILKNLVFKNSFQKIIIFIFNLGLILFIRALKKKLKKKLILSI